MESVLCMVNIINHMFVCMFIYRIYNHNVTTKFLVKFSFCLCVCLYCPHVEHFITSHIVLKFRQLNVSFFHFFVFNINAEEAIFI